MGIPSYFKHLLDRYPRLLQQAKGVTSPATTLLMDFNCLIYGCLKNPALPRYTHASRQEWETALLRSVQEYTVKVWTAAGRPAEVLLCVDGVVPMAKIRQQRFRRFKSVWLAAKEREFGVRGPTDEHWDTNAITPGTEFMERLTVALRSLCGARAGWSVSGAEEPGEGEQKCMAWVREQGLKLRDRRVVVYGLDADLIVLCLLHAAEGYGAEWSILREKVEFGRVASKSSPTFAAQSQIEQLGRAGSKTGAPLGVQPQAGSLSKAAADDQSFCLLSITGLLEEFTRGHASAYVSVAEYMADYICGMSLLGNDFLPHAIGTNIREGGHDVLRSSLRELHSSGGRLTRLEDGIRRVDRDGLLRILERWAAAEELATAASFQSKYTRRGPPPRTDAERRMLPVQNLPLQWAVERAIWNQATGRLRAGWEDAVYEGATPADIAERCASWVSGLQWILDYYTGQRPVSKTWYYAWPHPPLWRDLVAWLQTVPTLPGAAAVDTDVPLAPQEQLCLVLPAESWGLLRDAKLRAVRSKLPHFWPAFFGFRSLGKRWMWECDPLIPTLTPARLRSVLRNAASVLRNSAADSTVADLVPEPGVKYS